MAKINVGSGVVDEVKPAQSPATIDDPWGDILSGVAAGGPQTEEAAAVESPVELATPSTAPVHPLATVIELSAVDVPPVEAATLGEVEVIEVGGIAVVEDDGGDLEPAMPAEFNAGECPPSFEGCEPVVESREVSTAKLAYLTACLRLSAVEVRLDKLKGEIEEAEVAIEQLRERRDELEERMEPQHAEVMVLYERLSALLGPEELAKYEGEIEAGTVAMPQSGDVPWEAEGGESSAADAATTSATPENTAWMSRPTSELDFSSIRGCGPKKIEAIIERCPTIGDLEALRADFYNGGLKQIQGVGEKLAGELENLILDWLTKNRDWAVLGGNATAINSEPGILAPGNADDSAGGSAVDGGTPSQLAVDQQPDATTDEHGQSAASTAEAEPATAAEPEDGTAVSDGDNPLDIDVVVQPDDGGELDNQPADDEVAGEIDLRDDEPGEAEATEAVELVGDDGPHEVDPPTVGPPAVDPPPTDEAAAEFDALQSRFRSLRASFLGGGKKGLAIDPAYDSFVVMGRDDFRNDMKWQECIFTPGDKQDAWLAGWIMECAEQKGGKVPLK